MRSSGRRIRSTTGTGSLSPAGARGFSSNDPEHHDSTRHAFALQGSRDDLQRKRLLDCAWLLVHVLPPQRLTIAARGEIARRSQPRRAQGNGGHRTAPGLIAYRGRTPIGWVTLGPREAFVKLARSPVMKPVDESHQGRLDVAWGAGDVRPRGFHGSCASAAAAADRSLEGLKALVAPITRRSPPRHRDPRSPARGSDRQKRWRSRTCDTRQWPARCQQ